MHRTCQYLHGTERCGDLALGRVLVGVPRVGGVSVWLCQYHRNTPDRCLEVLARYNLHKGEDRDATEQDLGLERIVIERASGTVCMVTRKSGKWVRLLTANGTYRSATVETILTDYYTKNIK